MFQEKESSEYCKVGDMRVRTSLLLKWTFMLIRVKEESL